MKLLAVYKKADLASSRIRILQMLPHLERLGCECEAVPYPHSVWSLRNLLARAREFDVIWLQKQLLGRMDYLLWKQVPVPIVFDYDDAIMFRMRSRFGSHYSARRARRYSRLASVVAGMTCGNRYLAALAPAGQERVQIYPSPVMHDALRHNYATATGPLRVGWIGHSENLPSLARIAAPLRQAAARHDFVLVIVSNRAVKLPGVKVVHVPWTLQRQEEILAELDIGLMPLSSDSVYDQGKCSYKILQYLAAGVLPVADAVGMNAEVIQDGRNGRLVQAAEQWPIVLNEILSLPRADLACLAQTGPDIVRTDFSYKVHATKLLTFFASIKTTSARSAVAALP
ncbi:MAG: glycosyltransferase [Verrucomicrobiota bacterium]